MRDDAGTRSTDLAVTEGLGALLPAQRSRSRETGSAMGATDVRLVQLEILRTVDAFATAHGLRYYLTYGSLLGAIRHGGFIPWDDDVDVMMPRQDYERFVATFNAEPANSGYRVQANSNTADWPYPSAKVGDRTTTVHEGRHDPMGLGVNIDVFPVDALPPSRPARALDRRLIDALRRVHAVKMAAPRAGRTPWKRALLALARVLLAPCGAHRLGLMWNARAARPISKGTAAAGIRVGSYDWAVPTVALGAGVEVKFAGMALRAPADFDLVLRTMFGEYMVLPPEDRRVSHHTFTAHSGPCSARLDPPCPT